LLTIAGVAVVIVLTILLLYSSGVIFSNSTEPIHVEVEDPTIPLATPSIEG